MICFNHPFIQSHAYFRVNGLVLPVCRRCPRFRMSYAINAQWEVSYQSWLDLWDDVMGRIVSQLERLHQIPPCYNPEVEKTRGVVVRGSPVFPKEATSASALGRPTSPWSSYKWSNSRIDIQSNNVDLIFLWMHLPPRPKWSCTYHSSAH